ncbi:MAG: AMP-binding protein, partial [Acidimicrobiia bacterium]|nr:AMP-binding protein [Acidimicrobiia bacterium]
MSEPLMSTMQDYPLGVPYLFRHGRAIHGDSEVVTWTETGPVTASFTEVGEQADRLAAALSGLGVEVGDRVGTFCWNNQHHLEAYMAVSTMGAVLHT